MMNKSIEVLMNEHRLIEQVMGALETYVDQLEQGKPATREVVAQFARFFQNFADKCHHGKEEDRLFVALNQCGFPREYGPVGVMLAEHTEGRCHVRALAEMGQGSGPLSAAETRQVMEHAQAFILLLRGHIQKEDNILYPMAEQAIPAAAFEKLDADCEAFEREVVGSDAIQQLKDLALELVGAYPPDPERMAAGAVCIGCHGHA
jgi:hemerythrin-like domain-containing protein